MSHHDNYCPPTDPFERYLSTVHELSSAVDNPENIVYSNGRRPLDLALVEPGRLSDPLFQDVVELYGWPTMAEDGIIQPVNEYPSSIEFLASIPPTDEFGIRRLNSMMLMNILSTKPIRQAAYARTGNEMTGVLPVIHRADVLAPDLFRPLRTALGYLREAYGGIYEGDDRLMVELRQASNRPVADAMYMGYQIMGTLIKVDDNARISAIDHSAYDSIDPPILSADEHLRYAG